MGLIKVSTSVVKIYGIFTVFLKKKFISIEHCWGNNFESSEATFHPNRYFTEIFIWVPLLSSPVFCCFTVGDTIALH